MKTERAATNPGIRESRGKMKQNRDLLTVFDNKKGLKGVLRKKTSSS